MNTLKIGLIGAGTVGSGVIEILRADKELLKQRTGVSLEITMICDRLWREKSELIGDIPASDNADDIFNHPDIDVVVELIGGIEPAKSFHLKALQSGKSVVTANKALLARHGKEIFETAQKQKKEIGFEAAVAGALPVIKTLRRGLVANRIKSLYGILNGTCNFIISRMQNAGMEYEDALKLAQEKGFAEADPSFDVNGNDAAQKLVLLAGLSFDTEISEEDIPVEGISNIKQVDLKIASSMGWVVRLLAVAKMTEENSLLLRVHPAMIHKGHILASVVEEKNAVFFDTSNSGPCMIMGLGAGSRPTAAAVISDLIAIGRQRIDEPEIWLSTGKTPLNFNATNGYRFYLRIETQDRPGVLAQISTILAKEDISIASVHQHEGPEPVDLVIITYRADEERMTQAIEKIDQLSSVMNPTVHLRIEEDF